MQHFDQEAGRNDQEVFYGYKNLYEEEARIGFIRKVCGILTT